MDQIWLWVASNEFVLAMLALGLGVFHRNSHAVSLKESITWTFVWLALALLFNASRLTAEGHVVVQVQEVEPAGNILAFRRDLRMRLVQELASLNLGRGPLVLPGRPGLDG